jgi:hypothetical protein
VSKPADFRLAVKPASGPGAEELASSAEMRPYIEFAMAVMKGADPTPELEAIRQLPLEKRYVWRIVSALRWGFADFDTT